MRVPDVALRPARAADLDAVRELLLESALPMAGVDRHLLSSAVVACLDHEILGSAALELYGHAGLLRSVAVRPAWRGQGLGSRLVRAALDLAEGLKLERLYLLTETAPDFFARHGFQSLPRSEVDPGVQGSAEFTGACPDTALAMSLDLPQPG